MALRDYGWPCEIKLGITRSNMALRDRIWPCEIKYDLGRRPIALQEGPWLCKTVDGLARSNMALRDQIWPCEIKYGLARRPMALQEGPWPTPCCYQRFQASACSSQRSRASLQESPDLSRDHSLGRGCFRGRATYAGSVNLFLTWVSKKTWPECEL